jgi:sporulation protein YlmC with PRC-barrel domain
MLLTQLLRRPVVDGGGRDVGRLLDLTVLLGRPHPYVHRVLVGSRRESSLVPWSAVRRWDARELLLRDLWEVTPHVDVAGEPPLEDAELLLGRDVLDTQVVDLTGHRLSRVSDVVLVALPDDRLELAAADVSVGGILRRVGLRRLGELLRSAAVDWEDLHLTSSRGHLVQLSTSTAGMHRLGSSELAELLARLSLEKATDVMRAVGPERSAAALHRSHPAVGRRLLRSLRPDEARSVVKAAPPAASAHLVALHRQIGRRPRRRLLRTAGWRSHRPPEPREPEAGRDVTGRDVTGRG